MSRFKLTLEYDGAPYCGWQRQHGQPSVQAVVERAASALEERAVQVFAAGRTDAGVHALGQVVHLDLAKALRADTVRDALNHHLRPDPVAVLQAEAVADDFQARFDARERRYLYRIIDRRPPLALQRGRLWRVPQKLDAAAMHEAAQALVGHHDFSTFRDAACQAKSPLRTLDALDVSRVGAEIHLNFRARSWLHRQVRSITGTLVQAGVGKWTRADVAAALRARKRSACGPVAPACGLYLLEVRYGEIQAPPWTRSATQP